MFSFAALTSPANFWKILCSIAVQNPHRQGIPAVSQKSFENLYTDVIKSVTIRLAKFMVSEADVQKFLDMVLNVFETTILTVQDLSHATSSTQVVSALLRSFKMLTGKNVITAAINNGKWIVEKLKEISSTISQKFATVQSGGFDFDWCVKGARKLLDNYGSIRASPIIEKFHSLLKYFLTFGLFSVFGLDFASFGFKDFEIRRTKQQYGSRESFFFTVFEDVVWFMERGQQAIKLGSFQPFLHSSASYAKFVKDAQQLLEDQVKMSTPEAFDLDEHDFHRRLDSCIDREKVLAKCMDKKKNPTEALVLSKLGHELRMMQMHFKSKEYAQRSRRPPFCVIAVGDSNICKTQFCDVMFYHYGKVHGKSTDPSCKWTRNPCDKFYSGFSTSCWCIHLDDTAQFSPKLGTLDPTIADIIMICNGVAFTAPMADLTDKGVVPVRPDFVTSSTNVEDLNAGAYFSCPLACRRRFPYVVNLTVKDEYCSTMLAGNGLVTRTSMVDASSIPITKDGQYMNIWNIKLCKVVAVPGSTREDASSAERMSSPSLEVIGEFTEINDFLAVFSQLSIDHCKHAQSAERASNTMREVEICKVCFRPKGDCRCEPAVQAGEQDAPITLTPADVEDLRMRLGLAAKPGDIRIPLWHVDTDWESEEAAATYVSDDDMADRRTIATKCLDWADDRYSELVCMAKIIAGSTAKLLTKPREILAAAKRVGLIIAESALATLSDLVVVYQLKKVKTLFEGLGQKMADFFSSWKVAIFSALLFGAWAIWKTVGLFKSDPMWECDCEPDCTIKWSKKKGISGHPPSNYGTPEYKQRHCLIDDEEVPLVQGNISAAQFDRDEKQNPWLKDEMILSDFYVPSKSRGWKTLSREKILSQLKQNVVSIRSEFIRDGELKHLPATAVCVHGHLYMTNNHSLPEGIEQMQVHFSCMPESGNINANFVFQLQQSAILRVPSKDIAFFQCRVTPPRANLRDLFLKQRFDQLVCNGAYIHCQWHEFATTNAVQCIRFEMPESTSLCLPGWFAEVTPGKEGSRFTVMGDCGSPLIGFTPAGPVVLGMHRTLCGNTVGAPEILQEDVEFAISHFGNQIQCGVPSFASEKLGPLNHKSVLLWENEGQARVYGSSAKGAFRCAPKSRVADTFICEAAKEEGFVQRCGPPVMKGPEVWHNNIEPTVTQSYAVDATLLRECVASFTDDITSRLSAKSKSELIVLDDCTALNGMAGVKFLDKINRNTSMGYPYRKSKRNFLTPITATEDHPDPMEYAEEIMEEVRLIRDVYARGERYMPVFVMSLKDDPLPYAKIAIKKTRGFMGGPAAWQFICRKYLLAFVRIFQLNSFIFEGAPGLNCNSSSWTELYEYLTEFGSDMTIAGDFGWYDKKMSPEFILAAYDVIINVLRDAGWTEEMLQIVRCIGEDVAFPCVDIQGDFVELFGSNPSGHALTVIINCIVNCLYMRYCFAKISPDHSPRTFKKRVHLMTYGDDNAMNVHPNAKFFNHTAIAAELAKIKVTYTMADKHAESVPFVNIKDITFLKRSFVPVTERDGRKRVTCPLAWESIDKMLTSCVVSKSVCPEKQAMDSMRSAIGEFFQYGQEAFDVNVKKMHNIVEKCDLGCFVQESTFPSYSELLDAHFEADGSKLQNCSSDLEQEPNTFEPTGSLQRDLENMICE